MAEQTVLTELETLQNMRQRLHQFYCLLRVFRTDLEKIANNLTVMYDICDEHPLIQKHLTKIPSTQTSLKKKKLPDQQS